MSEVTYSLKNTTVVKQICRVVYMYTKFFHENWLCVITLSKYQFLWICCIYDFEKKYNIFRVIWRIYLVFFWMIDAAKKSNFKSVIIPFVVRAFKKWQVIWETGRPTILYPEQLFRHWYLFLHQERHGDGDLFSMAPSSNPSSKYFLMRSKADSVSSRTSLASIRIGASSVSPVSSLGRAWITTTNSRTPAARTRTDIILSSVAVCVFQTNFESTNEFLCGFPTKKMW